MPAAIPETIKSKVVSQWLQGGYDPKQVIAEFNDIQYLAKNKH